MEICGVEYTSDEVCESLVRHLEVVGEEVFEKSYVKGDKVLASVFAIVGPSAERMTRMFRRWCERNGFKMTSGE